MAAQAPRHPTKPPAGGPGKFSAIPTEWRLELPDTGATPDTEFGGCRSIESGYHRGIVLGQGTYGEVRRRRRRRRRGSVRLHWVRAVPLTAVHC